MSKLTYYLNIALILAIIGILAVIWQKPWQLGASVTAGNAYLSTTTPQVASGTNLCPPQPFASASSTTGTLGSVNIALTGTGRLSLVDSTTTIATQRAIAATSSLYLTNFPTSPTNGSYHYDIEFKNGLVVDYTSNVSSSTISYRCGS